MFQETARFRCRSCAPRHPRRWGRRFAACASIVCHLFLAGCGADGNSVFSPVNPPGATDETPGSAALSFSANPVFCCSPLTLDFAAELSGATLSAPQALTWDFGDDRTGFGLTVQHTYQQAGTYAARATAHLSDGRQLTAQRTLIVGNATASLPGFSADAGPDQAVLGKEMVTLAGAVTGEPETEVGLTFAWRQIAGEPVTLTDSDKASTTFMAPDPDDLPLTLEFELTVTAGASSFDRVRVTVWPSTTPSDDNVAPVVFDSTVTLGQDQSAQILLSGTDFDGDHLTFSVVTHPKHGSLTALGAQGHNAVRFTYAPARGFAGEDVFTFQATDGRASSDVGTCTLLVTSQEEGIAASDHSFLVPVALPVRITVTGEADETPDLTFELTNPPRYGEIGSFETSGPHSAMVVYAPDPGFEGVDTFEYRVSNGAIQSPGATVTLTVHKLIVPWLEVNAPTSMVSDLVPSSEGLEPGMTMIDYCLAGIESWAKVTDTVIVTTMPGQSEHLYPDLIERVPPHVRILGGLKTTRLPGGSPGDTRPYDFADPQEWAAIAQEGREIVGYTGINAVLLENETPLGPYTLGEVRIDFARLAESLSALRAGGVQYWWNLPRLLPDLPEFPDRLADTTQFVSTIADALPDSVFLGGYTAWFDWRYQLELRSTMLAMLGEQRIQERLLVTPDGYHRTAEYEKRGFTTAEAIERLPELTGESANVYPGVEYWVTVGRSFEQALPPLAEVIR